MAETSAYLVDCAFLNRRGTYVELEMRLSSEVRTLPDEAIVEIPCDVTPELSFSVIFDEHERSCIRDAHNRQWVIIALKAAKDSAAWRDWVREGVIQDQIVHINVRFTSACATLHLVRMPSPAIFYPQETACLAA